MEEKVSRLTCENEKLHAYNQAINEDFDHIKAEISKEIGCLRAECIRLSKLDGINLNLELNNEHLSRENHVLAKEFGVANNMCDRLNGLVLDYENKLGNAAIDNLHLEHKIHHVAHDNLHLENNIKNVAHDNFHLR